MHLMTASVSLLTVKAAGNTNVRVAQLGKLMFKFLLCEAG